MTYGRGLRSNSIRYESFLESNWSNIALCEKKLEDSIYSSNGFCEVLYIPLIWKDSVSYKYGFAVYLKYALLFVLDLSL